MARGADSRHVLGQVLREGLIQGSIGTALGASRAGALSRFLQGLLFGVSSFDLTIFGAMAGVRGRSDAAGLLYTGTAGIGSGSDDRLAVRMRRRRP